MNFPKPNGRNFAAFFPSSPKRTLDISAWTTVIDDFEFRLLEATRNENNHMRELQTIAISRISENIRLILGNTPPKEDDVMLVYGIFQSIAELATWTGISGIDAAEDNIRTQIPIINENFKTLSDRLSAIQVKFKQAPDPVHKALFEAAMNIVDQRRSKSSNKNPISFGAALEEANRVGKYYSPEVFDSRQMSLYANFTAWRYRKRKRMKG